MNNTDNICVFDINNKQEEYAYVSEFIECCENNNTKNNEEIIKKLNYIMDKISIKGGVVDRGLVVKYYESPIERKVKGDKMDFIYEEGIRKMKELKSSSINENGIVYFRNHKMLYHIRIHITSNHISEVVDIKYVALLLQNLEELFVDKSNVKKRLSVFIVPGDQLCPYLNMENMNSIDVDNEIYYKVSHYLRLLSKEYGGIIYGAKKKGRIVDITPINYRIANRTDEFFPVIIVNRNNYKELFEKKIESKTIKELQSLKRNYRFRKAGAENPNEALFDYIAETSFRHLQKKLENYEEYLEHVISFLCEKNITNWITFSIFCFAFIPNTKDTIKSVIDFEWEKSINLCMGIKQLVQNAIQYSEKKSCLFSFVVNKKKQFKIEIADINHKQTMIDSFIENLKWELKNADNPNELIGHKNMVAEKETIMLRNLFSDFNQNDNTAIWSEFRHQDLSAHIGLVLFLLAVKRYKASIRVRSSVDYIQNNEKTTYYKNFENNKKYEEYSRNSIPGTQFMITIPLVLFSKEKISGLGQLNIQNIVKENYVSFAECIELKTAELNCSNIFNEKRLYTLNGNEITDSKNKFLLVREYKELWKSIFSNKENDGQNVYYIDMDKQNDNPCFFNADNIEILVKGFFGILTEINTDKIKAVAFIGVNKLFLEVLRDLCIAFSLRKFPSGIQLYICDKKCKDTLLLFGNTYYDAIRNGYIMSMEYGSHILGAKEYVTAKTLYEKLEGKAKTEESDVLKLIPFDVILSNENKSIFNKRLHQLANNDIDGDNAGFLIRNTHMRLGSKVHIHSFYEMSFLFYRTSIANRIAFQIIRDIFEKGNVDILKDKIIFYGYASYSKAIITSITEILKEYRKIMGISDTDVSFVSYQHNLQSETEEIQMYYGFSEEFSVEFIDGKIKSDETIKVIQIVPISSTLTTFEKMWSKFFREIKEEYQKNFNLAGNYTVFWVTNEYIDAEKPTELEEKYWSKVNLDKQIIFTKFKNFIEMNANTIRYFIRCPVKWEHPLKCKWCYPENLIDEVPLVETDQTSTVPTQQIRKINEIKHSKYFDEDFIERIKKLQGCVSYGHFIREQNHFQYYIDTQAYFYKVKKDVKKWLMNCRERDKEDKDFPMMFVIFSPEHNTNVGFAQYVNTYYFGGVAEIISINEDKEYRSNFICEHASLIETIADLYKYVESNSVDDMPVKFYFVDDTIISGETFQKANSFLRSLLPNKYRKTYGTNIISKCFLLVDRLSDETKRKYVPNIHNDFYSFLHIDISNMRTYGDSCIGCKLQQDAVKLFKRASTRSIEKHWIDKIFNYTPIYYDQREKMKEYQTQDAYQRLVISHIVRNMILDPSSDYELGNTYDSIVSLAGIFLKRGKGDGKIKFKYMELLEGIEGIEGLGKLLKIVSRPFFSFDFKIKLQILTLIIILAELLLENDEQIQEYNSMYAHLSKKFIMEKHRLESTKSLGKVILNSMNSEMKLNFLQDVLLECMTDMKSTYLLRKQTLQLVYKFLEHYSIIQQEQFWDTYAQNIHRIIDCSSDEMKSFSFEYLLLSGEEYIEFKQNYDSKGEYKPKFLYEVICNKEKPDKKDPFYIFCHEIFFQNTRILFDGIEKHSIREESIDAYYMEQWKGLRRLEQLTLGNKTESQVPYEEEKRLFNFLRNKTNEINVDPRTMVKERYDGLLKNIHEVMTKKYVIDKSDIKISLLTWTKEENGIIQDASIGEMDILSEINVTSPEIRFAVKNKVVKAINQVKENSIFALHNNGYMINDVEDFYFIIYFDNSEKDLKININRNLKPIAKVYLFLELSTKKDKMFFLLKFMLRDVLVYRNRIMRMLESDFAGDMFTKYAHTIGEKNIIAHEKAISHNNTLDNENVLEYLIKQKSLNKYDCLDSNQAIKWLLMKNYVNEQIAKLFNRSFQNSKEEYLACIPEVPILYIDEKDLRYKKVSFFNNKLRKFSDLNLITDDRFALLENAICIKYNDVQMYEFIEDNDKRGYNVEFIKCILIDIIFSAISHEVNKHEFLLQIDYLLDIRKKFRNKGLIPDNKIMDRLQKKEFVIEFSVEKTKRDSFHFLVIRNPVYKQINDWVYRNKIIKERMEDPLDYPDGHLSLLTIKRYIEGLRNDLLGKTEFEYYLGDDNQLYFQSKLPIIERRMKNERDILDR